MFHDLFYSDSFRLVFLNHHRYKLLGVICDPTYTNALPTAARTIRTVFLLIKLDALMYELRRHTAEPDLRRVQELDGLSHDIHDRLFLVIGHEGHAPSERGVKHHADAPDISLFVVRTRKYYLW